MCLRHTCLVVPEYKVSRVGEEVEVEVEVEAGVDKVLEEEVLEAEEEAEEAGMPGVVVRIVPFVLSYM